MAMITRKLLDSKIKGVKILLTPFFPLIYLYFWLQQLFTPKILRTGIHAITGDTGSGKTMLAHLISKHFNNKGVPVLSNSAFNKTVHTFDILKHFNDFEIKKPITNCVVIFDEVQREFNKRLNRTSQYNSVFVPLCDWLSTHRHNGVYRVYFLTQAWGRLDIAFQEFIKRVHFVHSKQRPSFKAWLRSDTIKPHIVPKAILYHSRKKTDLEISDIEKYVSTREKLNRKGQFKHIKIKPFAWKVTLEDLADFNTYAFKTNTAIYKKADQEKAADPESKATTKK